MGKYRKYDAKYKVEALDFLKNNSVEKTAKRFNVDGKRIRDWRKSENEIRKVFATKPAAKRLSGGGRKVRDKNLEIRLRNHICEMREKRLRVSRKMIKRMALEWGSDSFKASNGWLFNFMRRYNFVQRKRTTISQNTPSDCLKKICDFILYLRHLRETQNYSDSSIYAMDETPIWIEPVGTTTVELKGSKQVPIHSTGHEKVRITVILSARADGSKVKPYIVIPRKRPIKELDATKDVVVAYNQKSWMDDALTEDYLNRAIGRLSFGKRLMVWDSFRCHISVATKKVLRKSNIDSAVIPGGCTSLIQAADVSWNKSLKDNIKEHYEEWAANGEKEFTKGGNMKPPSFPLLVSWVAKSWKSIPQEQIVNSMKTCAITTALDGSEDDQIHCLKTLSGFEALKAAITDRESQTDPTIAIVEDEEDDNLIDDDDGDNSEPDDFDSDKENSDYSSWCDSDESN